MPSTAEIGPLSLQNVRSLLERAGLIENQNPALDDKRILQAALALATILQQRASLLQTPQERRQQAELDRMLQHPEDKSTLTQITDQSFRSMLPGRVVDQMVHILDVQGVPRFFSVFDQALLKGFQSFGEYLPGVAVPMVKDKMRKETANVILPAEHDKLCSHLQERSKEGLRMNVNFLGEAILGERESRRRLDRYLAALQLPEIECVSIKISTLYSQISPLARKHSIRMVSDRLELLYRAAAKETFLRSDGQRIPKFVYLDMEEYRDLHLTSEIFMHTLSRRGMENVRGGIALQAYIPDSSLVQKRLQSGPWSEFRMVARRSPSASSKVRTWRWSGSKPRFEVGRKPPIVRKSTPMLTTSEWCAMACDLSTAQQFDSELLRTIFRFGLWHDAGCIAKCPSIECNLRCLRGWPTISGGYV